MVPPPLRGAGLSDGGQAAALGRHLGAGGAPAHCTGGIRGGALHAGQPLGSRAAHMIDRPRECRDSSMICGTQRVSRGIWREGTGYRSRAGQSHGSGLVHREAQGPRCPVVAAQGIGTGAFPQPYEKAGEYSPATRCTHLGAHVLCAPCTRMWLRPPWMRPPSCITRRQVCFRGIAYPARWHD